METPKKHKSSAPPPVGTKGHVIGNKAMLLQGIRRDLSNVNVLDLNRLSQAHQDIFIEWLVKVNDTRIKQGLPVLITYELIKLCPLWKIVRIPLIRTPAIQTRGTIKNTGTFKTRR